jgi:hypothetical protein
MIQKLFCFSCRSIHPEARTRIYRNFHENR